MAMLGSADGARPALLTARTPAYLQRWHSPRMKPLLPTVPARLPSFACVQGLPGFQRHSSSTWFSIMTLIAAK